MSMRISNHSYGRRNLRSGNHLPVDKNATGSQTLRMRLPIICLLATALLCPSSRAQAPVFKVTPVQSSVRFNVNSSRPTTGNFDKWTATLTFASRDPTSGVLDVEIQAASVHTPGGKNDDKLKGKDFLDVAQSPVISFKTTKVVQTGKTAYDVIGTFTMRGVSKPATLNLMIADQGSDSGYIQGIVPFDRKDYGVSSKGDDPGEVDLNLKVEHVSGPALVHKRYP